MSNIFLGRIKYVINMQLYGDIWYVVQELTEYSDDMRPIVYMDTVIVSSFKKVILK